MYDGSPLYHSSMGFWRFRVSSGVTLGLEIRRWYTLLVRRWNFACAIKPEYRVGPDDSAGNVVVSGVRA